ncbi:MAG: SIMPL domain-containing protein [Planctomycetota bacterium]
MNLKQRTFLRTLILVCTVATGSWDSRADEIPRTIRVMGTGTAAGVPDIAMVNLGVTTEDAQASAAVKSNSRVVSKLLQMLSLQGIEERDTQTKGFNVRPVYSRDNNRNRSAPQISGYSVSNQIRIRVRELDNLGRLLDELVAAGSNQISGISFDIDDPIKLQDAAKQAAVKDAMRVAKLYADAAGVRVGSLISLSESSSASQPPMPMARMAMAAEASAVPIAEGEKTITATIEAVFGILDP